MFYRNPLTTAISISLICIMGMVGCKPQDELTRTRSCLPGEWIAVSSNLLDNRPLNTPVGTIISVSTDGLATIRRPNGNTTSGKWHIGRSGFFNLVIGDKWPETFSIMEINKKQMKIGFSDTHNTVTYTRK